MGLEVESAGGPGRPSQPCSHSLVQRQALCSCCLPPCCAWPIGCSTQDPHDARPISRSPPLHRHRAWGSHSLTGESSEGPPGTGERETSQDTGTGLGDPSAGAHVYIGYKPSA